MTRVLVAGWIGSTNLGDELVFAGLRRLLSSHDCTVTAISMDVAATRTHHHVAAVSHRDVPGSVAAVGAADAVILGGGGLLQDVTSPLNLPYHLARVVLARARRTPFAGVGLGVEGLGTRLGRQLVRRGLGGAAGVTVRDEASRSLLADVGVPGARVAADLAFALDPPTAPPDRARDRLVVSLRPWTGRRHRLPAAARGDATPEAHVTALASALDRAAGRSGRMVRFVALQHDRDDAFHRRVAGRMRAEVEFRTPALDGVLAEYAAASAVVTMRYHGGVAAILAGVPSVLVSYAAKVDGLAAELGTATRRIPWTPGELAAVPDALAAVEDQHDHILTVRERLGDRQRVNRALIAELIARAADH
jgi:polysaccharide pyruvyl transferase CsaB